MRKTILFIETAPNFGGSIISLFTLIKNLDKTKYKPIVITNAYNTKNYFMQNDELEGVIHHTMKMKLPWIHDKIYQMFKGRSVKLAVLFRLIYWGIFHTIFDTGRFLRICMKYNPDIIHCNNGPGYNAALGIVSKLLKIPFIAHKRGKTVRPIGDIFKMSHSFVKHYIAISDSIVSDLKSFGISESKITKVWNGVTLTNSIVSQESMKNKFNLSNKIAVGIVGRITRWKGIDLFIKSAKIVLNRNPQVVFFVIGAPGTEMEDVHYEGELKQLVKDLGIEKNVIFTGFKKNILDWVNLLDIVVNSSIEPEPFGRTITEGMNLRKPIVAHNEGGPMEQILHNKTGLLSETGDYEEMAKNITKLIEYPEFRFSLGNNGFERVESEFSGNRYAQNVQTVYQRVL